MARVFGSSGVSSFYRGSLSEHEIKIEPGMELTADKRSPQSFEMEFPYKKIKEEDQAIDPECKSRPPSKILSGTIVEHASKRNPLNKDLIFYIKRYLSITSFEYNKERIKVLTIEAEGARLGS